MKAAIILLALALLAGIAMLAGGVYLLAGPGWCLISGAVVSFVVAGYLTRGIRSVTHGR